jgi:DNA polymerase (family X)
MDNAGVSAVFNKYADLLDITGENQFRIIAYRTAVTKIEGVAKSIAKLVCHEKDLAEEIPGVPGAGGWNRRTF